jgi:hypothetical protein
MQGSDSGAIIRGAEAFPMQSEQVARVWGNHSDIWMRDVTLEDYERSRSELQSVLNELAELERQRRAKMIRREQLTEQLNDWTNRVRGLVGVYLGKDSAEYCFVGAHE